MDYEIIKLKHVYLPLNCVSSTIHVFVQLKPTLSEQVLYLYIHNFTTYCINEYIHVHCSSVTKQISFAANLFTIQPPDHPQAELGLSHTWHQLATNTQRRDDVRLSVLNHSSTGAVYSGSHGYSDCTSTVRTIWCILIRSSTQHRVRWYTCTIICGVKLLSFSINFFLFSFSDYLEHSMCNRASWHSVIP